MMWSQSCDTMFADLVRERERESLILSHHVTLHSSYTQMCELLPEYTTMKKEKVLICKVKCKTRQRAIYQLLNPSPTAGHLTPSTEVHLF